jgi:outer membrane protein TolC
MEQQMKTLTAGWVTLVLVFALATRAGAAPLSLQQCIDAAIGQSPLLSAYRHKTASDRYEITKKRGTTLPYLSSTLTNYMINGSPVSPWTPLDINQPEIPVNANAHWDPVGIQEIGVSYPLYSEGSILGLNNPPAVASARAVLTEDQLTAIIKAQEVILDVSDAFLNASSYRDQLVIVQQLVQFYDEELEITKAQVALGLILPQQIEIVSAELAAARQAEESAAENERNNSVQLAALIGRHNEDGIELDKRQLPLSPLPQLNEFLSKVMPFHPALAVQDAKVDVARQQLRVDEASQLPTVRLNNDFSAAEDFDYFNGDPGHRRPAQFFSYITVDIPIWDFGQRHAATLESSEQIEYQKDLRRDTEVKIRTSIVETYGKAVDDARQIADAESKYVNASDALRLAQAQRKEGEIDELTLVSKEVDDASARVALEAAQLSGRLDYADLQDLSGGIWHWHWLE